jgi:SAM-dependent methyltransferase
MGNSRLSTGRCKNALFELQLVCPECLRGGGAESVLNAGATCKECGTIFPRVDGIPVLIAGSRARAEIAFATKSSEERTRFYQRQSEYLRERIEVSDDELDRYLADVNVPGVVLEIGSGAGVFAGRGGDDYCALDYSLTWLRAYLSSYRSICATAECIPLAARSCRFVFSFATLEHVPRADLAFEEIDRVLAPGGVAYLAPAWHCRPWAAEGLPVRAYRELRLAQKVSKVLIPIRDSLFWRGIFEIPWRVNRRMISSLYAVPSQLRYKRLKANYAHFWMADSDACSAIDSHEAVLFFETRGYSILRPAGGNLARLLTRGGAVVVRKALGR